ncbi:PAS domain S-box protein [Telluribacter sp.]|jgi:two-component system CheB/CheR fusion protein|uniref:PAS domain S-box protein n=1 Tax=Telluribacter sp. TaxID=1978767 RepID=UPI002E0ECF87|nr:PAS domain S-box protein [Telluribacter sp.]
MPAQQPSSTKENKKNRPQPSTTSTETPLYLIGVGASAGGLEALQDFLFHFPSDLADVAIIIAQHLSPTHKSMLVQLLSKQTKLSVSEAKHNAQIQKDCIYITPPDSEITIVNTKFSLVKPHSPTGPKPSVDILFKSMAEGFKDKAIGIILSGTGTDGAAGVKAIRANGGFIMAQEPQTAKYNGMPLAAIEAGVVDVVLSPDKMGEEIKDHIFHPGQSKLAVQNENAESPSLEKIFKLLLKRSGTDFSDYKPSTICRRLEKRLAVLSIPSVDLYLAYLEQHPRELDELFNAILIGVTTFFRDIEAFDTLRKCFKEVLAAKPDGEILRIWCPGCATGEEPYSIALLLCSLIEEMNKKQSVQIFATDIDDRAISFARRGIYPDSAVQNLPDEILNTYFIRNGDSCELLKSVRSMVLFSRHDVTNNPPFLKLDLISCRNLLIYFGPNLQKQVIPLFHYALNPEGYLFLGKSETVGHFSDLFSTVDGKNKLFQRKRGGSLNAIKFSALKAQINPLPQSAVKKASNERSIAELVKETLFNTYEHPYVVINDSFDIQEVQGDVRLYLSLSAGTMNANILKLVNKELQIELRSVITQAIRNRLALKSNIRKFDLFGQTHYVRVVVKPLLFTEATNELFVVIFERLDLQELLMQGVEIPEQNGENYRLIELEQELLATKEHLQTYIEEIETTNEELQSLNEELQSTNEELQSSNEELETTNEELQSTNEEIQVAYTELKAANEELERKELLLKGNQANLNALLKNTLQSFILVDTTYKIIAFNATSEETFRRLRNRKIKVGESVIDLLEPQLLELFIRDFATVSKGEIVAVERKLLDTKGNEYWFIVNFSPVIDEEGEVKVISIGMMDSTESRRVQQELYSSERMLDSVFNATSIGICITDKDGRFVSVNDQYARLYGYQKEELTGQSFTLVVPAENRVWAQLAHDEFFRVGQEFPGEWKVQRKDGTIIDVYVSAELLEQPDGSCFKITSVRDITENKRYKDLLLQTQEAAGVGGWEMDILTREVTWTEEVYTIFQVPTHSPINEEVLLERFNPPAGEHLRLAIQNAIEKGETFSLELESKTTSGTPLWIRATCKPIRIHNKTIKLFGTFQDVTGQKISEFVTRASEEKYRSIVENSLIAFFLGQPDGSILEANNRASELFGYTTEEFRKLGRQGIVVEDDEQLRPLVRERSENGRVSGELTVRTKDGRLIPCLFSSVMFRNQFGEETNSTMMLDISRIKEQDVQLRNLVNDGEGSRQKLEKAVSDLSKVMDFSLDVICTVDEHGAFLEVSKAAETIWGYAPGELIGRHTMDFVHPEDHNQSERARADFLTGAPQTNFENRVLRKDGSVVSMVWSAVWDEKDRRLYAIGRDASAQKLSELKFTEANQRLETAQEIAQLGYWEYSFTTRKLYWSDQVYSLFGFDQSTLSDNIELYTSVIHPDDRENIFQEIRQCIEQRLPINIEHRITLKNGIEKVVQGRGTLLLGENGELLKVEGTIQDITEIKNIEKALLDSENKYKSIFYSSPLPKWIYELETLQIQDVNNAAISHYGYSREEFLTMTVKDLRPKEDVGKLIEKLATVENDSIVQFGEWRHIKKNREIISVEVTGHTIEFNGKRCLLVVCNDITEKATIREALSVSNERYKYAIKATFDAVWDWDLTTDNLLFGDGYKELFGYGIENEENHIRSWHGHLHPDDRDRVIESINSAIQSGEKNWIEEYRYQKADGNYAYVVDRGLVLHDQDGKPYRMIGAMQDITQRSYHQSRLKELNEKLARRAAQLVASNKELEQFANVTSHDLQEPLRMITSFLQLLQRKYANQLDATGQEYINFAVEGAGRMKKLITDLLEYSRLNTNMGRQEEVDLNQVVQEVIHNFQPQIEQHEAEIHLHPLPVVRSVRLYMVQVIQNLVSNAFKYRSEDLPRITISVTEEKDDWVIAVSDNGIGIDKRYHDKIFILFQRLHLNKDYTGTGIGLAICKKIMDKTGGRIWVESEAGKGSTFYFTVQK